MTEASLRKEAVLHDRAVKNLWANMGSSWAKLGKHCHAIREKQLWKYLTNGDGKPFTSLDGWLLAAVPEAGRSTIYSAMKTHAELQALPEETLESLPRCNAIILAKLPESKRGLVSLVKLAQESSEEIFKAHINEKYPDLHLEETVILKIHLTPSQKKAIEYCLKVAGWVFTVEAKGEQLEALCADFMASKCQKEGFSRVSNREAYRCGRSGS